METEILAKGFVLTGSKESDWGTVYKTVEYRGPAKDFKSLATAFEGATALMNDCYYKDMTKAMEALSAAVSGPMVVKRMMELFPSDRLTISSSVDGDRAAHLWRRQGQGRVIILGFDVCETQW